MSSSKQQTATDLFNLICFSDWIRLLTHLIHKLQFTFHRASAARNIPTYVRDIIGILQDVEFNFGALGFNVELDGGSMFERDTLLCRFRGASLYEMSFSYKETFKRGKKWMDLVKI